MSSAPSVVMHDDFLVDDSVKLKFGLDHEMLCKFVSGDGTVNIRGACPIRVDDPLVLACFEGTNYRPHYRAMRFVHSGLDNDAVMGDTMLHAISKVYRNRPLVMEPIPQQEVFEYTDCGNLSYTSTGFIPGSYTTFPDAGPESPAVLWSDQRPHLMVYVYAVLPPTFRSAHDIKEETKFTWFANQRTLTAPMGELHEILEPCLEGNSGLVRMVLSFIPCDAEVLELALVDVNRKSFQGRTSNLWPHPNQFDQIQCLKDDDINGNKWVRCPVISLFNYDFCVFV